ncbi:MAG TPA: type II toxin-antitoxin system PrlF family antitoxin [Thermoanaerobaculia bacterium]|jgi:AbrB family looped-hinge helix DNA binding protein|nr:type II toxin-antitoxin system PrlF family antitoxin [Thermoanaerobaculia bacterium]
MPTATVTSKGQITLPKTVRELLRVDTGDRVDFVVNEHGDIVVRAVSLDVTELKGLLKRPRRRSVSVNSMNAAILGEHSRKR